MHSTSRYAFCFPVEGGVVLYSSSTGGSMFLAGNDAAALGEALVVYPANIDMSMLPKRLSDALIAHGIVVEKGCDEISSIRKRYVEARDDAPVAITVTLTQDCNLGCYYCFQSRERSSLTEGQLDDLVERVRIVLENSGKSRIHVSWYGGEPMLNQVFLVAASNSIMEVCETAGVRYAASIISNGTGWPEDALSFVRDHRIGQVQISFDGMRRSHNKIRRVRPGYERGETDQFTQAVHVVDQLKDHVRVDARFNVGENNLDELVQFADFGLERGWFAGSSMTKLQVAKVTPYSAKVEFIRKHQLDYAAFERLRDKVRTRVGDRFLDSSSAVDFYPQPRTSVCAALAKDSIVVGADGRTYRCGLQISEPHRSTGRLEDRSEDGPQTEWWTDFDPTRRPKCARCSFLPVCWGSCPKLHLEEDDRLLDEQSDYWRTMLPRRVAAASGRRLEGDYRIQEHEQFRDGRTS